MRIAPAMLAIFASLIAMPLLAPVASVAAADGHCTNWTSRTEPPQTIRVYRQNEGFVETVDFKHYVYRVVSNEWNVPSAVLRRAGAHAVKQYAWYHILHYRGGKFNGQCFDVKDTTADQLYASKDISRIPDGVKNAVDHTWTWRLYRGEKFVMTGYRRGTFVGCAEDAGWKLYVRSARKCVQLGWSTERILKVYYTAKLVK